MMRTCSALSTLAGLTVLIFVNMIGAAEATSTRNFFSPQYLGQPVAFCLDGNKGCGKPAASAWCKVHGYDEALSFARRKVEASNELRFIDSGGLCNSQECIGFGQIRCLREAD